MPYPDHLLARGETVVLHKHPHWKVLALPVLWLVVIVGAASFGIAFLNSRSSDPGFWPWVIVVAALLLLVFLVLVPFVKWRTEHFVLTDRHVFFRAGFFKRREHQIPLGRIQNLEVNVSFWGRILGYGTLTVESAADQPLSFYNVASLPRVQGQLNQLIDDDRTGGHPTGGMGERRHRPDGYDPDEAGDAGDGRYQDTRYQDYRGDADPRYRQGPPPGDGQPYGWTSYRQDAPRGGYAQGGYAQDGYAQDPGGYGRPPYPRQGSVPYDSYGPYGTRGPGDPTPPYGTPTGHQDDPRTRRLPPVRDDRDR